LFSIEISEKLLAWHKRRITFWSGSHSFWIDCKYYQ